MQFPDDDLDLDEVFSPVVVGPAPTGPVVVAPLAPPKIVKWIRKAVSGAKYRAKKYNREFDLTAEDMLAKYTEQQGVCYWFSVPMGAPEDERHHPLTPSIDRVDSNGGYTFDNVVWCCLAANTAKRDTLADDWEEFLSLLEACAGQTNPAETRDPEVTPSVVGDEEEIQASVDLDTDARKAALGVAALLLKANIRLVDVYPDKAEAIAEELRKLSEELARQAGAYAIAGHGLRLNPVGHNKTEIGIGDPILMR